MRTVKNIRIIETTMNFNGLKYHTHTVSCRVHNIHDMMSILNAWGYNNYDLQVEHEGIYDSIFAHHKSETDNLKRFVTIVVWFI